jgi:outer membrane protein assembly factor BamB
MKTLPVKKAVVVIGLLTVSAIAADWPQWRGPQRDGLSTETGLMKEWPKGGPKLIWQLTDIGSGYSTPAVVGDRFYIIINTGDDEYVEARSIADGKKMWSRKIGKVGRNSGPQYPGSRSTPTVDGDMLYALGSDGDLVCLDTAAGKEVWHKSLRKDFSGKPGMWAYSESPLIDGNVLVCTPGGTEATVVALNKTNGQPIWKSPLPEGDAAAYASPIVTNAGGVSQYVTFLSKGVVGIEAKSGKLLWRYDKTAAKSPANIPTPVAHDGSVYTSTSMGGAGLFKIKGEGSTFEADPVYFDKQLPSSIGGSVLIGGYLYGTNGKGLMCVEFSTGKVKWTDSCVGPASVCSAEGRLYLHGEKGDVALVEATPEGYHELGRFTPPNQPKHKQQMGRAWPYPVVANGRLYFRDLDRLWCYDISSAK